MYGVVYLILNKINGRKYVGQTVQPLEIRFDKHTRSNYAIGRAIRKYGKENFYCGVIKTCASKEELDYWEKYYIATLKTKKTYGYNLTDGGEGTVGLERTPEHCAKLAASKRGKNNPNYGKHPSNETRAKRSASLKGRRFSEEHCAKLAAAQTGKRYADESRVKMSTAKRNSPFKNLITELDKRQLTYASLADILSIARSNVTHRMQGVRKFTEDDKVKLEKFFGKPIEYLLARDDTKEF
ncbi:MAG: GIY-YIG nuclease family protein [Quinella sp. 3Q1]|nr:GIY-YIG nuclease family protein [Quinella sp. 3Q1]MBR3051082.1 GIY-YIG nuclease family protein [Selenomonadaceae bacterium]MBR6887126.1 GIY-YIG nuclease family protein [Selenomonadaceae bacterium]